MKYFITYQQFGGGAQAIHNQIIEIHPSVWAEKLNSAYKGSPSSGRYVILFYHEMHDNFKEMDHCIDIAWGIIANAYGGNWDFATTDWRKAAERWRDKYLPATSSRNAERANNPS